MRLLHAQAQMEDDRKLCEYLLPEGAVISALFEADVDINIEVSTGKQMQKFTVSNAMSVMVLKVQICGIMRCGVAPEKLETRLEDVTLEDPMPLHFCGVKDGSRLDAVKPYVNITVETSYGTEIYWCLSRKDAIGKVKVELATNYKKKVENPTENIKVQQYHLHLVSDGQNYDELDDKKNVENSKIKEDDKLYMMSYMWTHKMKVIVKETNKNLPGCERDDTCLGIKVKAQDQLGLHVNTTKLVRLAEYEWAECNGCEYNYGLLSEIQETYRDQ